MSRIALIGENSIEYINALIDIWNDGNCALLIDWRIPPVKAIDMMRDAGAKKCIIEKKFFTSEYSFMQNIEYSTYERKVNQTEYLTKEIRVKFQSRYSIDEAAVIYSSGTTGKARGIILSHYAINSNADSIIDYMNVCEDDCIYTIRSLSHSSTITGELLVALKSGAELLVGPIIVPPRVILNNIIKFKVSVLGVNPTLLSLLTSEYARKEYDISSLKKIYSAGAILDEKTCNESRKTFSQVAIYNSYGLTEAGPRVCSQTKDHCNGNSVGKPIKNVEIAVIDESGFEVVNGSKGIVHVNTDSLYSGYILGQEKHMSLYKGWLNTGDVGYIDSHGELHIVDRIDDMIIVNAHNIYPSEVEKEILSVSAVRECVVTCVEHGGIDVVTCVYVSEEDIETRLRHKLTESLMPFEIPRFFIRVETIPRTLNGKISKKEIQEIIKRWLSYQNVN